jgi:glutamate synthase domain-containing protein 2
MASKPNVQVASGRFGVHKDYLNAAPNRNQKGFRVLNPDGGHLPGTKIVADISKH